MRVLVSSTAGSGHFAPLAPVLDALVRKGDDLLMVLPPGLADAAEATGHPYRLGGEPPAEELAAIWDRVPHVSRGEAAILVNREIFGRLDTEAMLPAIEAACDEWRPDLIVHEPAEFATAVAAGRRGLPHVQVAIGLASVEAASVDLAAPVLERYGDDVVASILRSPYLTRFPASLDPSPYPATQRFRESPASSPTGERPLPDWWNGDERPLVYVSFGTVAGALPIGETLYRDACLAVADLPARVLVTSGRTRDLSGLSVPGLGSLPANVHIESWVDQQAVLREANLVVCHGGAGTTFGALAEGLPLVVVPLMADQPTNGRVTAGAGAAIVVPPRLEPVDGGQPAGLVERLRAAIEQVLGDPTYGEAASRIAAEMRGMPDLDDVVETLRP